MMNSKSIKSVVIIAIIVVIFGLVYFLFKTIFGNNSDNYNQYLKDYKVNEYIPTYVSDESMVKIYLNDYVYNMYYDIDKAYNSLDENYRNEKFGNKENYINYVNSLNYSTYNLTRYYKQEKDGYIIFGAYDQNNNLYIFKTKGVMQYVVFLDDYTVEI